MNSRFLSHDSWHSPRQIEIEIENRKKNENKIEIESKKN